MTSDEKLLEQFSRHNPTLEAVARMLQEDRDLAFVDQDKYYSTSTTSDIRIQQYRDLLKKAGVTAVVALPGRRPYELPSPNAKRGMRAAYFQVVECSNPVPVASKGYAYSPDPIDLIGHVVESLDEYGATRSEPGRVFRRIDSEWFLYVTPP